MGGRIHGAFFAAALLQVAASLAACATAGDGGAVDGGEPSLDAPAPRDGGLAREDATTRPNDAGDGALGDDGDAAVTPGSPETSDFGTPPQDSGAAGDDDAGGDDVLEAHAPGDGSADGAIDGGATDAAGGDAAIADASTPDGFRRRRGRRRRGGRRCLRRLRHGVRVRLEPLLPNGDGRARVWARLRHRPR